MDVARKRVESSGGYPKQHEERPTILDLPLLLVCSPNIVVYPQFCPSVVLSVVEKMSLSITCSVIEKKENTLKQNYLQSSFLLSVEDKICMVLVQNLNLQKLL